MNTRNRFWISLAVVVLALVGLSLTGATATQATFTEPETQPAICQMAVPNSELFNVLNGVSAVPATPRMDTFVVWAVGYSQKNT
jgi:hypothetical protein